VQFECRTLFDITATGITGHFKSSKVPFQDRADQKITNDIEWNRSRNQQRNWETLTQLISMRAQLFELSVPVKEGNQWTFVFSIETPEAFGSQEDPVSVLRQDADGIPMLLRLDNDPDIEPAMVTQGDRQNIWFRALPINTI
jgi:hypothetical protein